MADKAFAVSVTQPPPDPADIYQDVYGAAGEATVGFRVTVTLPPATVGFTVNVTAPSGQRVWTGSAWRDAPLGSVWSGSAWR